MTGPHYLLVWWKVRLLKNPLAVGSRNDALAIAYMVENTHKHPHKHPKTRGEQSASVMRQVRSQRDRYEGFCSPSTETSGDSDSYSVAEVGLVYDAKCESR